MPPGDAGVAVRHQESDFNTLGHMRQVDTAVVLVMIGGSFNAGLFDAGDGLIELVGRRTAKNGGIELLVGRLVGVSDMFENNQRGYGIDAGLAVGAGCVEHVDKGFEEIIEVFAIKAGFRRQAGADGEFDAIDAKGDELLTAHGTQFADVCIGFMLAILFGCVKFVITVGLAYAGDADVGGFDGVDGLAHFNLDRSADLTGVGACSQDTAECANVPV